MSKRCAHAIDKRGMFGILGDLQQFIWLITVAVGGVSFLIGKWYKTQTTEMKSRSEFRAKIATQTKEIKALEKEIDEIKAEVQTLRNIQQDNRQEITRISENVRSIESKIDTLLKLSTGGGSKVI